METGRLRERNRERLARHEIGAGRATASIPPGRRGTPWLISGLVVDLGIRSVLLDRLDPVQRGRLALVDFAGRDDLSVAGYQVEVVLAPAPLLEHELAPPHPSPIHATVSPA